MMPRRRDLSSPYPLGAIASLPRSAKRKAQRLRISLRPLLPPLSGRRRSRLPPAIGRRVLYHSPGWRLSSRPSWSCSICPCVRLLRRRRFRRHRNRRCHSRTCLRLRCCPSPTRAVIPSRNILVTVYPTSSSLRSGFPDRFVVARSSSFVYKGKNVKVQEVGREVGVKYVLEGEIQRSSNQVRINVQLAETTSGEHLWAEHYERPVSEILSLQDDIVRHIATTLQMQLTLWDAYGLRADKRSTDNFEAYDY